MEKTQKIGLFNVQYRVTNHLRGGVEMYLNLTVNTVDKRVVGVSRIFQAIHPPLNILSEVIGEYSYMCTMRDCHILVVADGYHTSPIIIRGVPQVYKNLRLRMVLEEDWKTGTATYEYLHNNEWHEVKRAKVEQYNDTEAHNIERLATTVKENEKEPVA